MSDKKRVHKKMGKTVKIWISLYSCFRNIEYWILIDKNTVEPHSKASAYMAMPAALAFTKHPKIIFCSPLYIGSIAFSL